MQPLPPDSSGSQWHPPLPAQLPPHGYPAAPAPTSAPPSSGFLVTLLSFGLLYPFALVLRERWRAKHFYIEGRQLTFNGSAWGVFGLWWKWLTLIIITIGIYSFWVTPRIYRWKWEHTSWAQQISYR